MAKKQAVKEVQAAAPVSDDAFLSELAGATPAPQVAEKPKSKKDRPSVAVTGDLVQDLEVVCASKAVTKFVESVATQAEANIKAFGYQEWRKKCLAASCKIDNPQLIGGRASAVFQFKGPYKVQLPSGVLVPDALKAAGLRPSTIEVAASLITEKTETTLVPLQVLQAQVETKPIFDKIKAFVLSLSPEERKAAMSTERTFEVADDLVPQLIAAIASLQVKSASGKIDPEKTLELQTQEFNRLFSGESPVIKPVQALSSSQYGADTTESLEFLKGVYSANKPAEKKSVNTTVTTKVEEKVAA